MYFQRFRDSGARVFSHSSAVFFLWDGQIYQTVYDINVIHMYLYLNTIERDSFSVALIVTDKIIKKKTVHSKRKHSEKLLKTINGLLKFAKKSIQDLDGIAVVRGPGSFTSLRIGVSTANALAFGLGIQAIGVNKDEPLSMISGLFNKKHNNRKISIVLPEYGQEPNITMKKS